jgi:hypothetical protein
MQTFERQLGVETGQSMSDSIKTIFSSRQIKSEFLQIDEQIS